MKKKNPNLLPKTIKPKQKKLPTEIKNEKQMMVKNGISEAIMGFEPGGQGVMLSQADSLFRNNRWYLVSNMRQLLSEIYVELGIVQTVVDIPVDDAFRGGIIVKTRELDEEDIEKLQVELERNSDIVTMAKAMKWNRLFGGAGVVIITGGDPASPLQMSELNSEKPFELRAVDMWELFWSKMNTSDYSQAIDSNQLNDVEFYNYYGVKLHHSRVIKLVGVDAPSFVRPRLRGWGCSIVETLVRSINQYLKANNLTYEVLDEFKIDYYKLKNLANTLLTPGGEEAVRQRVALTNRQKNFQNAVVMDGEDDFGSKELSFTGISETMSSIRMQLASDMRIPLTKLFGVSASGFSSGEDDIENYNAMVESQVRQKAKYALLRIVEIRCQKIFGFVPDDLSIEFKPLRVLSAEAEENVKTQKFSRLLSAFQAGVITNKDFIEGCNRDRLLPMQLDADLSVDTKDGNTADDAEMEEGVTVDRPPDKKKEKAE